MIFSDGLLRMNIPVLADKQRFTYIRSVLTQDAALSTYLERWIIEMYGKREPRKSVLLVGLDDNDDMYRER